MEKNQNGNQILFLKVSLYLMSLWILLFMLLVLKADVSCFSFKMTKEDVIYSLRHNGIPLMCIGLSVLGGAGYLYFKDCLDNAKGLPVIITECKSANYENLSFLATYIIPLVCFPMENERQIFVLFSVILIIGCIFVKTNLFYTNPSLVFCKHFLEKNAKYFWRMLHLQIGESCKASAGSYSASYIAIADHI